MYFYSRKFGLGTFSKRVLVPGGVLVCYFGGVRLNKLYRIFDDAGLDHLVPGVMLHGRRQKLWGIGALMNHKNILCYSKGPRRPAIDGRLSMMPTVVNSVHDKSLHGWAQGDGGVWQWIFHLTDKGDTIVDPFAGTETWLRIGWEKGRHMIGCDIEPGGSEMVVA